MASSGPDEHSANGGVVLTGADDLFAPRSLEFYEAVAHQLAQNSRT